MARRTKPLPSVTTGTAEQRLSPLAPRERQTLDHLLLGASEKETAYAMGLSIHTVHVYVKNIYKRYDVHSRGELLSKMLRGIRELKGKQSR
jgi:DNA-binding CsgD family transcriptional regulator